MKKWYFSEHLLVLMGLLLLSSCNRIVRLYVDFADVKSMDEAGVIRLCFDHLGYLYPPQEITQDEKWRNSGKTLKWYYNNNPDIYQDFIRQNAAVFRGQRALTEPEFDPLQNALIQQYARTIDAAAAGKELVFLIHGYNKHPELPAGGNSRFEYEEMRKKIQAYLKAKPCTFVEVYWDGLSKMNGWRGPSKLLNTFKIWDNSQASATQAGLEFRRLLKHIQTRQIRVITHSHGAGFITNALFNVRKFRLGLYNDPGNWLYRVSNQYQSPEYETPQQQFTVGMLAPAIPGVNVFNTYSCRTIDGREQSIDLENYRFVVGFNKYDPVTSKYGLFMRKFGSTSLASSRKELDNTKKMLNSGQLIMADIDFSRFADSTRQSAHPVRSYMHNSLNFERFLAAVFEK